MGGLWRSFVRPLLWLGAKGMGSEALVTERNIIRDMAGNKDLKADIRDIVRRNVAESAHIVTKKVSGQERKRKKATYTKSAGKAKKAKKQSARGKNNRMTAKTKK